MPGPREQCKGAARLLELALVIAGLTAALGCSHTFYQFDVSHAERVSIQSTQAALAASATNPNALAQVVDLDGRRAIETLIAGMTIEQTEGDRQLDRLIHALYLGVMAEADDPIGALSSDATWMAAHVAQRIATHGLNQLGLGGIAQMVGVVPDDSGPRLAAMSASLTRGEIGTCLQFDVIVSYDAGILGHIHASLAEQDPTYVAWRQRVRAIHLVRFTCRTRHALMVLTHNHGEAGARAIGWHFLTQAQWDAMRPELRRAFDLPQ